MKNKSNLALAIGLIALTLSIYNTYSSNKKSEDIFIKSENKTYLSPDPKAKRSLSEVQKSILDSPLTPQTNNTINLPKTSINFEKEIHEFGNVNVNSENKYSFKFTNTGNEPLKITNAKGSCGCTVPNWPKDAIMPGATEEIDIIFRPSKNQAGRKQTKTVTVTANTNPENTILKISAFVNKDSE
tara:strand:+ start:1092 stop:1646 length:555 start_codon:yes stop_codon:yes gene_type:complete